MPYPEQMPMYGAGRVAEQPQIAAAGGVGQMGQADRLQQLIQNSGNYNADIKGMQVPGEWIQNLFMQLAARANKPNLTSQVGQ